MGGIRVVCVRASSLDYASMVIVVVGMQRSLLALLNLAKQRQRLGLVRCHILLHRLGLGTDLLQVRILTVQSRHNQIGEVALKDLLDLVQILLLGSIGARVVVDQQVPLAVVALVLDQAELAREHDLGGAVGVHGVLGHEVLEKGGSSFRKVQATGDNAVGEHSHLQVLGRVLGETISVQQVTQVAGGREAVVDRVLGMAVEVRVLGVESIPDVESLEVVAKDALGGVVLCVPVLVEASVSAKDVKQVVQADAVGVERHLFLAGQDSCSIAGVARVAGGSTGRDLGQLCRFADAVDSVGLAGRWKLLKGVLPRQCQFQVR